MDIAALSVTFTANADPLIAQLGVVRSLFAQLDAVAVAAGKSIDAAFAGEAAKMLALQESLAGTVRGVGVLGETAQASGLQMNAAFATQAGQLEAIAAAAKNAGVQTSAMATGTRGGVATGGAVPSAAVPGVAPDVSGVRAFASEAGAAISGFVTSASAQLRAFGAAATNVGRSLSTVLTLPIVALGGISAKLAGDFEASMTRIQSTFHLPAAAMKELSALAIQLGADVTLPNTSAVDAAHALDQLMSSGLSMKDAMGAARSVLQLSAVAMLDNKTAALITAQVMNAYSIAGKDAALVTDTILNGMRATGATAQDFAKGLTNAGAAAKLAHQSLLDVATVEALLIRNGMTAPAAGTAITTMLLRIINPTAAASKLMKEFNLEMRDTHGVVKPIPAIFAEFTAKIQNASTFTRAFGGDTAEMNKKLAEAQTHWKAAQKVLADTPPLLALQGLRLSDLKQRLADVDAPARKLTNTIGDQKAKIAELTKEMQHNITEGLRKMGRENEDTKGRISETTLEIGIQQRELQKLTAELGKMPRGTMDQQDEFERKQLEVVRLTNSIRSNKENVDDWNEKLNDNQRQMVQGLDSTKQKRAAIADLTKSMNENVAELDHFNAAEKGIKTSELSAQIVELNHQMDVNRQKMVDAAKVRGELDRAQSNAKLVQVKMTDAERDHIVGQIFGQRGFKPIEIGMNLKPGAFENLKKQMAESGVTASRAAALQKTLGGMMDGLRSSAENLGISIGERLLPHLKGLVHTVTDWLEGLNKVNPKVLDMAIKFALVAASVGPMLLALGTVASILGRVALLFTPVGLALTALTAVVALIGVAWATNFGGIQQKTAAFVAWVTPFLQAAWAAVSKDFLSAWKAIQQFGKEIWPSVQQAMTGFAAFVKAHGKEIVGVLRGAWEIIKGVVQVAWAVISGIIKVGLDILNGDWKKAWGDLGGILKGIWDGIFTILAGAGVFLVNQILLIGSGIRDQFDKMFAGWLKMWQDWGVDIGARVVAIGAQIVGGLVNGLDGALPTLAGAVTNIATLIMNTIKSVLGIRSPSAVMYEAGQNVGQGLADGILSKQGAVQAAAEKLSESLRAGEKITANDPRISAMLQQSSDITKMQAQIGAIDQGVSVPVVHAGSPGDGFREAFPYPGGPRAVGTAPSAEAVQTAIAQMTYDMTEQFRGVGESMADNMGKKLLSDPARIGEIAKAGWMQDRQGDISGPGYYNGFDPLTQNAEGIKQAAAEAKALSEMNSGIFAGGNPSPKVAVTDFSKAITNASQKIKQAAVSMLGPGGGSGQDAFGNVEGQAKAINSGSSTGSGHFMGQEYGGPSVITVRVPTPEQAQNPANIDFAGKVVEQARVISALANVKMPYVNDAVFGSNFDTAEMFHKGQQLQAEIQARNAAMPPSDLFSIGQERRLRQEALASDAPSLRMADGTVIKRDMQSGAKGGQGTTQNVTQNLNIYGGVNNAGDLKTVAAKLVDQAARALRYGT